MGDYLGESTLNLDHTKYSKSVWFLPWIDISDPTHINWLKDQIVSKSHGTTKIIIKLAEWDYGGDKLISSLEYNNWVPSRIDQGIFS